MTDSKGVPASAEGTEVFWGIDVASEKLDLGEYGQRPIVTFANDDQGIAQLIARVVERGAVRVIVEATGGYETKLVVQLAAAGLPVVVVNPLQARRYAEAVGLLEKNDQIDARMLARMGHDLRPEVRPLPTENERFLADLVARRRQLVDLRTAEQNRRQQTCWPEVRASIDALLASLDEQLRVLDKQLGELIQTDRHWHQLDQILRSFSGIGPGTSRALLAGLPELGQLDNRQIAKLVGVAPLPCESGKRTGRAAIRGGRANVRAALYMAAFNARRKNPAIRDFFERLRDDNKPYQVAMTACMRKILVILNAMIRNRTHWNPNLASEPLSI